MTERKAGNGAILDDVSKRIIAELQVDGRRSYAAIGKAVGLSEAAVRQRVQKLTDAGIIQIVAVTDPLELGFARQAMVGICVDGDVFAVTDSLAAIPELDYLVITTGRFDVLAEIVCESDDDLLDVITSKIRAIPAVTNTETFVYLRLRKQTYAWGVQ
ncbi:MULTISPECIES: Lrp/AsnC family transcriptional regulator [Mumia]|uniref:Lrp/AsnC family transcriptional regulator n=1 Tax=Mumia TaxID=1546255 RepID=UPI00141FAC5D|nr:MULTISPECIES: Lrp/AsnC family transcriptional regulator [unclassified Mumia]QMW65050.1 Lrp/AsnC family transcriptional regulator [Mumia sp. ZJ1417]